MVAFATKIPRISSPEYYRVGDKYHRMDGNAIRRPRETGSRSGAMESHDSQPSSRRRHLIIYDDDDEYNRCQRNR